MGCPLNLLPLTTNLHVLSITSSSFKLPTCSVISSYSASFSLFNQDHLKGWGGGARRANWPGPQAKRGPLVQTFSFLFSSKLFVCSFLSDNNVTFVLSWELQLSARERCELLKIYSFMWTDIDFAILKFNRMSNMLTRSLYCCETFYTDLCVVFPCWCECCFSVYSNWTCVLWPECWCVAVWCWRHWWRRWSPSANLSVPTPLLARTVSSTLPNSGMVTTTSSRGRTVQLEITRETGSTPATSAGKIAVYLLSIWRRQFFISVKLLVLAHFFFFFL